MRNFLAISCRVARGPACRSAAAMKRISKRRFERKLRITRASSRRTPSFPSQSRCLSTARAAGHSFAGGLAHRGRRNPVMPGATLVERLADIRERAAPGQTHEGSQSRARGIAGSNLPTFRTARARRPIANGGFRRRKPATCEGALRLAPRRSAYASTFGSRGGGSAGGRARKCDRRHSGCGLGYLILRCDGHNLTAT